MKNKQITLGYVHIESYKKGSRLFPDYYYEKDDDWDNEDWERFQEEVKSNPPDEVILKPNQTYDIVIDYPLSNPFIKTIDTKNGMTRQQVVDLIVKCYKQIYKEEDKSTKVATGNIPGMFNRNTTDGKYGIWGHDIGDLILHTIEIKGKNINVWCDS